MQMRNWRGPLLATLVLVASCGGDDEDAAPTTTESPATSAVTTTTEAVDPFTVPDDPADITEAYVEAVANELYRILGDATRLQIQGVGIEQLTKMFDAVYDQRLVDDFLNSALEDEAEGFPNVRPDPGNAQVAVQQVLSASDRCIAANVVLDVNEVLQEPVEPFSGVLLLRRLNPDFDPEDLNPTPWVTEGVAPSAEFEGDPCA